MPEVYILLAVLIFSINIIPAFMPPTWMVLAFFYITFDLSFFPTIIIGALMATLGRIALSYMARDYFRPLLSKKSRLNYSALGKLLNKNRKLTIPLIFSFAFLPIPSNQIYIAVGLSKANINLFALSFCIGRIISDSFWVALAHRLNKSLSSIFILHIHNINTLIIELLGFAVLYGISIIPWNKILKNYIK